MPFGIARLHSPLFLPLACGGALGATFLAINGVIRQRIRPMPDLCPFRAAKAKTAPKEAVPGK